MASRGRPRPSTDEARREAVDLIERIGREPDARRRAKLARRLAFVGACIASGDIGDDLRLVEVGIAALGSARRHGATNADLGRSTARLVRAKLAAAGEPAVVAERRARVAVDSGCVCCSAEPEPAPESWRGPIGAVLAAINRGLFFLVSIGGDGPVAVTLRVVSGTEPVLRAGEYRWLVDCTDTGFVRVDRPTLYFGPPERLRSGAQLPIGPGWMKIQVFHLDTPGGPGLVAVVCPSAYTDPELREVPELREWW
jgi:hypothetical protein